VRLDPGLPDHQAAGRQGGQAHLQTPHPEHSIPQACVFSPLLYTLYTHDCVARSSSNTIIKFVDDTVVGLISGNDEKAYLVEVANLSLWCQDNSLMLNVSKTNELIVECGNSSSKDRRALQRVVRSAEHTIGTTLPTLQDLYSRRCRTRACRIMKDPYHPNNKLKQSVFLQAIRTVNSDLNL